MSLDRWREIESLYEASIRRPPDQRSRFLAESGVDEEIRRKVESLLEQRENLPSFLERPALHVAANIIPRNQPETLVGRTIDHYEVLAFVGSGGMGSVYRARDSRLNRDVALKVLPVEFSKDPEWLRRSKREAQLLASLNHPNIGAIYDLEESDGIQCLILEFVEGESLAERLRRGRLPLAEALEISRQIAEALEAAHEQGIVHRDLKPGNVMIAADGRVKVLDFGIAKMLQPQAAANAPVDIDSASAGVAWGTPSYMSPEQARGKPVDKRTDIWAFGCVLYEMVTGRRAFHRETVTDTLAAVVEHDPDWQTVPTATPAQIQDLLRRCLMKDTRQRRRDIGEARIQIEEAIREPAAAGSLPGAPSRRRRRLTAVAGIVVLLLGGLVAWSLRPARNENFGAVVRLSTVLQATVGQTTWALGRPAQPMFAISPDGKFLVQADDRFNGGPLYLRSLDQTEGKPIPGTEGAIAPFFSPDSQWIAFWQTAPFRLKKVAIAGGPPFDLCNIPSLAAGATWTNEGILFSRIQGWGIWQVPSSGGTPKLLLEPDREKNELAYLSPQLLPDGKTLLFTVRTAGGWNEAQVVAQSLQTGKRRVLIQGGASGRYVPSGHLMYLRTGTLMAVPFDVTTLKPSGERVSLIDGVMQAINMPDTNQEHALAQLSVSDTGTLVYLSGGINPGTKDQILLRDRNGHKSVLSVAPAKLLFPRFSPDGQRVSYLVRRGPSDMDVWVYDMQRGTSNVYTSKGDNWPAVWSPDGTKLMFSASVDGVKNLFSIPTDGNSAPHRVTTSEYPQFPSSWSQSGLAYLEQNPRSAIWVLPMQPNAKGVPFLRGTAAFRHPEFSTDGKWIAYTSNETGRNEVYVQAYPGPGGEERISIDGGQEPAWRKDELFYIKTVAPGTHRIMAVHVETSPTFKAGTPRVLFEEQFFNGSPTRGYDVSPDGQRFMFISPVGEPRKPVTEINVVLNWFEEVKRRAPVGTK